MEGKELYIDLPAINLITDDTSALRIFIESRILLSKEPSKINEVKIRFLTKDNDVLRKKTFVAENLENAKGICNFYKKTSQTLIYVTLTFKHPPFFGFCFCGNFKCISVLKSLFKVLEPNRPQAGEVRNLISESAELDF